MTRRLLAVALVGLLVGACADADSGTASTGVTAVADTTGVSPDDGGPTDATSNGSDPTDSRGSVVRPTSPSTTPVVDPGGTVVTVAAEQPPPPVAGCLDAPVGPAVVDVSFDDDTLRYAGQVAPPCVRLHAAQALRIVNAAAFSSTVFVGATATVVGIGRSYTTAALGTMHGVGDVFDVRVEVLASSVLVQVLR